MVNKREFTLKIDVCLEKQVLRRPCAFGIRPIHAEKCVSLEKQELRSLHFLSKSPSTSKIHLAPFQAKIVKTVDVSYGGENGFNQAIELAADALADVKFLQEKKLISNFFAEIAQDSGKEVYGVASTLQALEMGAVETLICWENLDVTRYELKNAAGELRVVHLTPQQEKNKENFLDPQVRF